VSGFGPDHLPWGVWSRADDPRGERRVGVRIDDRGTDEVLDVSAVTPALAVGSLDALMALGPAGWREAREAVAAAVDTLPRIPLADVVLHLPFTVADYVDFYASEHHAGNVGRIFRPDQEPLLPHWRRLPVGYHGRAGTVVVSGTPVRRPRGQLPPSGAAGPDGDPTYGPTRRLDLEAELGFVVGAASTPGEPVGVADLAEHVFGVVGLDDWSARDVQNYEYRPLGPFLGKSFATSVSAWVTPLAALDAAWCDLPGQHPVPLPHLGRPVTRGLDIDVEVVVNGEVVSRPPYSSTYWSPAQMLAHLTSNGAPVRTGDLFASGTISGPGAGEVGSLLELSWGGSRPWGEGRTWLEDGDVVTLRYSAPSTSGGRLRLGDVTGTVLPALPTSTG
jgi:fumarylacetoacetase